MESMAQTWSLEGIIAALPPFARAGLDYAALQTEWTATCATVQTQPQPRLYQVETTARCNLACPFCPRTTHLVPQHQRDPEQEMSLAQFDALLDQAPWVRSLELFHFGEPFMQRTFAHFVASCTRRGVYSVVASNLLPATPRAIDAVCDAGLNFLVMDMDSLDAERYAKARVNGSLPLLRERVQYLLSHPKRPYCVAQQIALSDEQPYTAEDIGRWAMAPPPDAVRVKFLDSFRGTVLHKGGMRGDDLCREPFYGCAVHANGDVVPCDRDWGGEAVMGNVFETPLLEIWHGDRFEAFRAEMRGPDKPALCRNCDEGKLFNARSQPHVQVNMFDGQEVGK
jgi:radical SAM protein with 4Fe4S-binding SPASM domain